jgi:pyruvate dehydrogenase E2 component (dihydrolipoamide acetyltransferase)
MKVFNLPDLGEGLPDAEIVEWLVEEGDVVELDQPMVSMETAKAVVEVPSPYAGKVVKFHGGPGDVIQTGAPLAEFEVDGDAGADESTDSPGAESAADEPKIETAVVPESQDDAASESETETTFETDVLSENDDDEEAPVESDTAPRSQPDAEPEETSEGGAERADTGTVVGNVQSSNEVLNERTSVVGGVKVTPAVRALARKLKVDLSRVEASGPDGIVTAGDVRAAAETGQTPAAARDTASTHEPWAKEEPRAPAQPSDEPVRQRDSAAAEPESPAPSSEWEPIRGTRRTMARVMSESHKQVVPTSLMDDADIHAWRPGEDITARLLRALWAGARAEPGLNAWYDGENNLRMRHKNLHVGMAVDTADGLFVAALRDVDTADRTRLRSDINRLRENVANRSIPPDDLKDYTIVLSNFGKFAGRYATPVITPPCVAIVAAGKLRHDVVPVLGGMEVHRIIPISLTFDHRACTGGEAARFLKAMLDDLARAE